MNTRAFVYNNDVVAGYLAREDRKFVFQYDDKYLLEAGLPAISISFPKKKEPYISENLFPFFFGLLAEGENKDLQCRALRIDEKDHFTRLLKTSSQDTIGGITVKEIE